MDALRPKRNGAINVWLYAVIGILLLVIGAFVYRDLFGGAADDVKQPSSNSTQSPPKNEQPPAGPQRREPEPDNPDIKQPDSKSDTTDGAPGSPVRTREGSVGGQAGQ